MKELIGLMSIAFMCLILILIGLRIVDNARLNQTYKILDATQTVQVKRGMAIIMYGADNFDEAKAGTTVFELDGKEVMKITREGSISIIETPCVGICVAPEPWYEFFGALEKWNKLLRKREGL